MRASLSYNTWHNTCVSAGGIYVDLPVSNQSYKTVHITDSRMAAFSVRHGDPDIQKVHFSSGVSTIPSLPAKEVVPMLVVLQVPSIYVGILTTIFP